MLIFPHSRHMLTFHTPGMCSFFSTRAEVPLSETVSITAVPIQHWGRRGLTDTNEALWAGYIVQDKPQSRKCFFAGDTGYCPAFKEIGQVP